MGGQRIERGTGGRERAIDGREKRRGRGIRIP